MINYKNIPGQFKIKKNVTIWWSTTQIYVLYFTEDYDSNNYFYEQIS